ncbi:hypothetical protein [Niallia taxi]|uniref:hypothetical protein n=1 Tax=Niallia taxi TaxID=2499688 RepID=UPI0015F62C41|nr:hypothetical protein [Niallia taxi]
MTILDKEKIQVINLQNNPSLNSEQIYIPSKQSANVLFRFMNKLEFLEDIILKKAIIPRYYEEKLDYLQLDSLEKIAIPMSCFCDCFLQAKSAEKCSEIYIGLQLVFTLNSILCFD